jgi:hypothetical protein
VSLADYAVSECGKYFAYGISQSVNNNASFLSASVLTFSEGILSLDIVYPVHKLPIHKGDGSRQRSRSSP